MKLNDKVYDILKWVAQIVLPALGTLYLGISSIWGLPYAQNVIGTITVVDTFLGVLLGISTHNYQGDGTVKLGEVDPETDLAEVQIHMDDTNYQILSEKKHVVLKVEKE